MVKLAAFVLFLAGALPAQNLFTWNGWTRIAQQWQVNYTVTPQRIEFHPFCAPPCNQRPRTGISQTVRIPTAGKYTFRFRGYGGGTGTFQTEFTVGTATTKVWNDNWHVAPTLDLPAGNVTIAITTDTSNLLVDFWSCAQPELTPAIEPAIDLWVTDAGDPNNVRVRLNAEAQVLAASLNSLPTPVPVPSFAHGLELDPASLIIFAVSPTGSIRLDLSRDASLLGYNVWPKMFLQALSAQSFGSLSWF